MRVYSKTLPESTHAAQTYRTNHPLTDETKGNVLLNTFFCISHAESARCSDIFARGHFLLKKIELLVDALGIVSSLAGGQVASQSKLPIGHRYVIARCQPPQSDVSNEIQLSLNLLVELFNYFEPKYELLSSEWGDNDSTHARNGSPVRGTGRTPNSQKHPFVKTSTGCQSPAVWLVERMSIYQLYSHTEEGTGIREGVLSEALDACPILCHIFES